MLQGTPAEPPPLIYHITPTPVYAGWSKIYIRRIATPIAQTIWLIHVIIRDKESHQYNLHVELSGFLAKTGVGEYRKQTCMSSIRILVEPMRLAPGL